MKILAGKIVKAQGIKGEVKVECYLDSPSLLKNVKEMWLGIQLHEVKSFRENAGFCYVQFGDINDRNSAENLVGWQIYVWKGYIELKDGSYFLTDMLGCSVYLNDGQFVGIVEDIAQHGSADVYTCKYDGGELSFPFLRDLVENVKIDSKRITLKKSRFDEVVVYQNDGVTDED